MTKRHLTPQQLRRRRITARLSLAGGLALLLTLMLRPLFRTDAAAASGAAHYSYWASALHMAHLGGGPDTLVVYIYSNSDPEYEHNLEFFVRHGMREGDSCEYIIAVQHGVGLRLNGELPRLPSNARYVHHENMCFDWGTIAWLFSEKQIESKKYKYFMFMNSSIRGPFLPAFWPAGVHWSRAFTAKLIGDVKLVGSTISCEPAQKPGDPSSERRSVHVQSYAVATDQVGLEVLQKDGSVFKCHATLGDAVWNSEIGASSAILRAGYNLDCLMLRYAGVDWRDPAFANCNAGENPYKENSFDGVSLNPLEVMFVKVKGYLLELDWTTATWADAIDRWMHHKRDSVAVTSNLYLKKLPAMKKLKAMAMAVRGARCFDVPFYLENNPALPKMDDRRMWEHFVIEGQFETRPFRFKCPEADGGAGFDQKHSYNITPDNLVRAALEAAQGLMAMMGKPKELSSALQKLEETQAQEEAADRAAAAAAAIEAGGGVQAAGVGIAAAA
mmetsp:Transcript_669/g.1942  ORF Transcript_669/g.1942 Transcript_669/m.1942 type:complete len:501 (-) Transcript_669:495-1997(-)|eukprot:CAMPEP_0206144368 /NCGR_PEP_ID=MMETSP1473-20131121/23874_1 /ASSEMBLY_ACC=CAM_ASM_001109 /TAXON_ID=1461547 /ORGANISM="Stichococcus sp, Strain RCC1054" /LENGTH=500 /DNA_ID=CAMNT_0053540179 /DNA_START=444 /DNA_END=1946 /DNA_ORIENTATION=+